MADNPIPIETFTSELPPIIYMCTIVFGTLFLQPADVWLISYRSIATLISPKVILSSVPDNDITHTGFYLEEHGATNDANQFTHGEFIETFRNLILYIGLSRPVIMENRLPKFGIKFGCDLEQIRKANDYTTFELHVAVDQPRSYIAVRKAADDSSCKDIPIDQDLKDNYTMCFITTDGHEWVTPDPRRKPAYRGAPLIHPRTNRPCGILTGVPQETRYVWITMLDEVYILEFIATTKNYPFVRKTDTWKRMHPRKKTNILASGVNNS